MTDSGNNAPVYSRRDRLKNFFYYYKWWLALGIFLFFSLCSILMGMFGKKKPDYSIACISGKVAEEHVLQEIENAFALLGEDLNGDKKVTVRVHYYPLGLHTNDENTYYYGYAADVRLQADILANDSYLFLMEDPQLVQTQYQILADREGRMPAAEDSSVSGRAVLLRDTAFLDKAVLSDEAKAFLEDLYIGRRGYYGKTPEYLDKYEELWQRYTR